MPVSSVSECDGDENDDRPQYPASQPVVMVTMRMMTTMGTMTMTMPVAKDLVTSPWARELVS